MTSKEKTNRAATAAKPLRRAQDDRPQDADPGDDQNRDRAADCRTAMRTISTTWLVMVQNQVGPIRADGIYPDLEPPDTPEPEEEPALQGGRDDQRILDAPRRTRPTRRSIQPSVAVQKVVRRTTTAAGHLIRQIPER